MSKYKKVLVELYKRGYNTDENKRGWVYMKKKIYKKGLSLIVLMITVLVLSILAAAVILSMSNNRPIDSAKEATNRNDDSVMLEAANLLSIQWQVDIVELGETRTREKYIRDGLISQGFSNEDIDKLQIQEDGNVLLE